MADAIIPFRNLTGGTDDSYLDYWDGDELSDGQMAFGTYDGKQRVYRLNATSGETESTSEPYRVISPDTNAGTKRWILQIPGGAPRWVDRGDPSAYDFEIGDLTADNTWRDLDLSSIVPSGVSKISFWVSINSLSANSIAEFRKNGNSNAFNVAKVRTQAASQINDTNIEVYCDSSQIIEYKLNSSISAISIVITGWYIDETP